MTNTLTENFIDMITEPDFIEKYWRTISQSILNNAFINTSRPKMLERVVESGVVRRHPVKELLMVANKETEIALLAFDLFCRVFSYRWMVKLQKDRISKKFSTQNTLVGNFLISIFYLVGEMLVDEKVKGAVKSGVSLTNTKLNAGARKVRPIVPLSVKKKYKAKEVETKRLIVDPPLL
jgi:hypothetical protein